MKPNIDSSAHNPIFVIASLLLAYLFCDWILFGGTGISVTLFTGLFYLTAIAYLQPKPSRLFLLTMIPPVLLSACFVLYDNLPLRFFNIIALFATVSVNLFFARQEESPADSGLLSLNIIRAVVIFPFKNLSKSVLILFRNIGSAKGKNALKIAAGLVLAAPAALMALALLMNSDSRFEGLVNSISGSIADSFRELLTKLFVAVILSFPLFSLLYSYRQEKACGGEALEKLRSRLRVADNLTAVTALSVLNILYLIYLVTQLSYLIPALQNVLPAEFSYSSFARRGFFELVTVTMLNLAFIFLTFVFAKRQDHRLGAGCRYSLIGLSAQTLFIIATDAAKMTLYIREFGLTPLRVYTSWFMLMLAAVFLLIIIKTAASDFQFFRFAAVTVTALYLMMNFMNFDALIPRYNIARYHADSSVNLDVESFARLSDSMVAEILPLRNDPRYGSEINALLKSRKKALRGAAGWKNFSIARYSAVNHLNP